MVWVQYAFMVVLVGVLVTSAISFVVMGLGKVRRTRRLARAAHERGRRFFRDDPYDVPRRYAEFAVVSGGHCPRADNVTDGRLAGRPVRAFDFRYEVGHGTRRITRHYSILVADLPWELPGLLMWHDADAELAPLAAGDGVRLIGKWSCRGPGSLAAAIARACPALEAAGASAEARGSLLMLAAPAGRSVADYVLRFEDVEAIVAAIPEALASGGSAWPARAAAPGRAGTGDAQMPPSGT